MYKIKTLETNNHTYYYGYVSKYEQSEEEKAEHRYFFIQRIIGALMTVLSILMICNGAAPAILLTIVGIAVMLTDKRAICL